MWSIAIFTFGYASANFAIPTSAGEVLPSGISTTARPSALHTAHASFDASDRYGYPAVALPPVQRTAVRKFSFAHFSSVAGVFGSVGCSITTGSARFGCALHTSSR